MATRRTQAEKKGKEVLFFSFQARGGKNATTASSCCLHHQMMGASLLRLKLAASGYLDTGNNNGVTEFKFLSASHDLASAMRMSGLRVQAGQMRKVFKDFRMAKTHKKKQRIVESVARTLINMTPRRLSGWTIAATNDNPVEKGFGYALYEIGTDGRLVDISDVNLEGVMERGRTEVNSEGTVDHDEWNNLDGEGLSARLEDAFTEILDLLVDATQESCPVKSE